MILLVKCFYIYTMRFLRKFNESLEGQEELQEYCEMNLAYLIDDGFFMDISLHGGTYIIILRKQSITNRHGVTTPYFRWDDIKDHYIPFIERIRSKYKLASSYINFTDSTSVNVISYPYYQLDDKNIYWGLSRITFKIEENSL